MTTMIDEFAVTTVNTKTGEEIDYYDFLKIMVSRAKDQGWNKAYIKELANMLNVLPGAAPKILAYLLLNHGYDNEITATNKSIAEELQINQNSVASLTAKLVKEGFLRRGERGIFMLSPFVLSHGNAERYNRRRWEELA